MSVPLTPAFSQILFKHFSVRNTFMSCVQAEFPYPTQTSTYYATKLPI